MFSSQSVAMPVTHYLKSRGHHIYIYCYNVRVATTYIFCYNVRGMGVV